MPLRDHFHQPLADFCPWSSFHANWSVKMVDRLNTQHLERGRYTAQSGRHFGAQIEADVAALERAERGSLFDPSNGRNGGVATAPVLSPPAATLSADVRFDDPDLFEVKIYRGGGGWHLVAAVELVSEANKDREENRRAFAVKCASYLQKGISLVVIDTVTTCSADLHDDLCGLIEGADALRWASPSGLSVIAYRATRKTSATGPILGLDVRPYSIGLRQELPTVPLWLGPGVVVPLELEATYQQTCSSLHMD